MEMAFVPMALHGPARVGSGLRYLSWWSIARLDVISPIFTIGHSTRSLEDFLQLLQSYKIEALADVRQFPGSRRHPQFGQENLSRSLSHVEVAYVHFPELGGRRRARADSPNTAWRNEAFRGYADYMMTSDFQTGIARLMELAQKQRTAIMCAEALWWRCHRALISDFLKVKSIQVVHILSGTKTEEHPFTSAARVINGQLSYRGLELPGVDSAQ